MLESLGIIFSLFVIVRMLQIVRPADVDLIAQAAFATLIVSGIGLSTFVYLLLSEWLGVRS